MISIYPPRFFCWIVFGLLTSTAIHPLNAQTFQEFQTIQTQGATHWEAFTMDGETYLAVANSTNGSTAKIPSIIYKWVDGQFTVFQAIPTHGGVHWEYFTIDGESYLAVANSFNDVTRVVDSQIYKWDGSQFVTFQSIPTENAWN